MESAVKKKRCRRNVTEIEEGEAAAVASPPRTPLKRKEGGDDGGDDDNDDGGSSSGGDRLERSVTEEDVEEFYAILRRVREARRLGGKATREEIWQPQFAWEDFQSDCNSENGKKKTTSAAAAAAEAAAAEAAAAAAEAAAGVEVKTEKVFDLNMQPAAGIDDDY